MRACYSSQSQANLKQTQSQSPFGVGQQSPFGATSYLNAVRCKPHTPVGPLVITQNLKGIGAIGKLPIPLLPDQWKEMEERMQKLQQ